MSGHVTNVLRSFVTAKEVYSIDESFTLSGLNPGTFDELCHRIAKLSVPTDSTLELTATAVGILRSIFRPGFSTNGPV